jgi:hypothetical protein
MGPLLFLNFTTRAGVKQRHERFRSWLAPCITAKLLSTVACFIDLQSRALQSRCRQQHPRRNRGCITVAAERNEAAEKEELRDCGRMELALTVSSRIP